MEMNLSELQQKALHAPCPRCGGTMEEMGDMGDYDHDLVACAGDSGEPCDFVLFWDGSTMDD